MPKLGAGLAGLFRKRPHETSGEEVELVAAEILRAPDPAIRSAAAMRADAPPDLLFALAADPDSDVRRGVAGNPATPILVHSVLARDQDVDVRAALLRRLVKLLPDLSAVEHHEVYQATVAALETLAHDQVRNVREALTNTLKDVAYAPLPVVQRLARDVERSVAEPVLRLCANLTDADLLEILSRQPGPWALAAIAARKGVSGTISNAIVDSGDVAAGSILLDNRGAVIEEPALEHMVDQAASVPDWQARLASRDKLPARLALRLADVVDETVIRSLSTRQDFDSDTQAEVVRITRRRLDYRERAKDASPKELVEKLRARGGMDEDVLIDAISWNDRPFVVEALAALARAPAPIVNKVLAAQNGKVITALAWRAGLTMRAAIQLQTRMAGIAGRDVVNARGGTNFPLSEADMIWQLEYVGVV